MPLAGTTLYRLVTEAHRCKQLAKVVTQLCLNLNPQPVYRKSNALPVAPSRHLVFDYLHVFTFVVVCHSTIIHELTRDETLE